MINKLAIFAVAGMLIGVITNADESARIIAWGLAVCFGVIAYWVNALEKQINELKSNQKDIQGTKTDIQSDAPPHGGPAASTDNLNAPGEPPSVS